jgi:hypothetical protein
MAKFPKHDADIHMTPDVSHVSNPDVAHEASDVDVRAIIQFVVGLFVLVVVTLGLMWAMFKFLEAREKSLQPKPAPMAMSKEESMPPAPRLQAAPGFGVPIADGLTYEDQQKIKEHGDLQHQDEAEAKANPQEGDKKPFPYKVENGMINLEKEEPQAEMRVMARKWRDDLEHGRRDEKTGAQISIPIEEAEKQLIEKNLPSRTQGNNQQTVEDGIYMPTYSSSGRMTEKRRQ